ncbi:MAG: hypothetical protein ACLSVD_15085 [Eggerthellaceae bacterium]
MIDKAIFTTGSAARAPLLALSVLQGLCIVGQAWSLATALTGIWNAGTLADQALWIALFFACFVAKQRPSTPRTPTSTRTPTARHELRQSFAQGVRDEGPVVGTTAQAMWPRPCWKSRPGPNVLPPHPPKITAIALVPLVVLAFTLALDWCRRSSCSSCSPSSCCT